VPFDLPWYRRLLGVAFLLGITGGVLGLVYLGATGWVIDRLFPASEGVAWSGDWWWIPLTAVGGLVVVILRTTWHVPDEVPGGVALIEAGAVDHMTAPQWLAITAMSAIAGASLGPSFALILMGGGLGSWIASRSPSADDAAEDYTLTGAAGAFGAAFTSPILGAFLVSELEPIPRQRYVASIIPQLIASLVGFVVFYSVEGRTFLGSYEVPPYDFEVLHLALAVGLGVIAAFVMLVFLGVIIAVKRASAVITNRYALGVVGGAIVGLIAFALPLTIGSGQSQLGVVIGSAEKLGIGLLIVVLVAKMAAMSLSLQLGFMGGNVFPAIFIGGTAGIVVSLIFPDMPEALAVGCLLAAVPGSYLRAPVSMVLVSAIALYLAPETIAPVAVSVVTAYLLISAVRYVIARRRGADASEGRAGAPATG
jgi:chloride channel protein, CIC family